MKSMIVLIKLLAVAGTVPAVEEETQWWGVVATVLAIAFAAVAVFFFVKYKKLQFDYEEVCASLNGKRAENDENEKMVTALAIEKRRLQSALKEMNGEIDAKNDEIASLRRHTEPIKKESDVQSNLSTRVDYASVPSSGVFSKVYGSFVAGKTMYKLSLLDENHCEYEFISDEKTIGIARQSRTIFLEPACIIVNDDDQDFTNVVVVSKGAAVRTDEGWKITKKAEVSLA